MRRNVWGGGAETNKNGLLFEQVTSLNDALTAAGYHIRNEKEIFSKNELVGLSLCKNRLYTFLEERGINYKDIISKKLLPDDVLLNLRNNTAYIIEKKFQSVEGSVDEKLQTCDFKRKQYIKLLKEIDIEVVYIYILNDWFKKPKYRDVLQYISIVNCRYYFNQIPLNELNL